MKRTFAVLDIKCGEISAIAAHWGTNNDFVLEGFFRHSAKGISKGIVKDASRATDSIMGIISKLREKTGRKIHEVYTTVSSPSIEIVTSSGTLLLSKFGREVFHSDVNRCVRVGSVIKLPRDMDPLHKLIRQFTLDGEKGIKNPVGLEGVKLDVNIDIVAIKTSVLTNLNKCISLSGLSAEGIILSGIANSYRAVSNEDAVRGVALLNVFRDMTEFEFFYKENLTTCKAYAGGVYENSFPSQKIIPHNLEDIGELMANEPGWENVKEIIVVSEDELKDDLIRQMEAQLNRPVKEGTCMSRPFEYLPADRMAYIGCLGILDHLHEERKSRKIEKNTFKRIVRMFIGFMDKYF